MNELLDAALYYAGKGWPVIPLHGFAACNAASNYCDCRRKDCPSPAKHPRTANGLKDATTDAKLIRKWWTWWPEANIGLLTGVGFDVLDVDGQDGQNNLSSHIITAECWNPGDTDTIIIETGGGGRHYLFKPLGEGNRAGILSKVDWRGSGGYIVAPPSIHASSKQYKRAECSANDIAEAPSWLVELVQKPARQPQPAAVASEWTQASVGSSYGQRALEAELAALATAEEGTRNHQLNKSAFSLFQLVKAGVIDYRIVRTKLESVADRIGLDDVEIERTLDSAWKAAEARELANPTVATILADGNVVVKGLDPLNKPSRRLIIEALSELPSVKTNWLWDGRVPMGALTLVGGREGIGKSTLCYDIASDVTRGTVLGFHRGTPRNVLIVATEDDWSRTIKPRLTAAKANLDRIFRVKVELDRPDSGPLELTLPHDTEALTELVKANDVDLILLDPLLSRVDVKLDSHKDADVRTALEPVTRLASETGCAVLGLIHVNKSGSKDPLTSLMGSRAFVAVARAVLFVMVDPEDDKLRLLLQAKNNLGLSDIPALRFSIDNTPAGFDFESGDQLWSGKLNWRGESGLTVDTAMEMSESTSSERTAVMDAADWLKQYLEAHNGLDESRSIKVAAKTAGISESTLDRCRARANVATKRVGGFQGPSVWYLPGHEPAAVTSDSPVPLPEASDVSGSPRPSPSPLTSTTTTYINDNSPVSLTGVDDDALI